MITLRCTRKLLKRLGGVTTEAPLPSTTIFGDGVPLDYGYPKDAAAERCRAYLR